MPGHFYVFLLGLLTTASVAQLSNRTIDDEFGDSATGALPEYFGHWIQGAVCDGCAIRLDTAKLFRGTWHGTATSPNEDRVPTITLRFTGVAIYVYNVLANSIPTANFATGTRLTFTLDGAPDGRFVHTPTDSTQFLFNRLVYAHTGLANAEHVLVIQPDTAQESLCMFDYAQYTFFNQSIVSSSSRLSSSSSTSHSLSFSSTFFPSSTSPQSVSSPTSGLGAAPSSPTASLCSAPCPTSQDNSKTELSTPMPSQQQAATQTTAPLGGILGGSIGGGAIFLVLLIALWVYMRTKRRTVWSWLPPYEGTTETRQTRNISSREIREDILHITSALSRPSDNPSRMSSVRNSLPPTEDTEHGLEVIHDNRLSLPSLFSDQPTSFHGLTASVEDLGRGAVASPHTSTEVVIDGKLQFSDVGSPIGQPASAQCDTVRRSFSPISMARSTETSSNEEVLSQLASLRAEVAGLRAQQEAQRTLIEAPPRYGEGM